MRKDKKKYTSLRDHKQKGKILSSPLGSIDRMEPSSWFDERLPDLLWIILINGNFSVDEYQVIYRKILNKYQTESKDNKIGIAHTRLSIMQNDVFDRIFSETLQVNEINKTLSCLLFFDALPDIHHWKRHLKPIDEKQALEYLSRAIAQALNHQSKTSTHARWLKVFFNIITGKMHVPKSILEEHLEYERSYNNKMTESSARASELALFSCERYTGDTKSIEWARDFWEQCYKISECIKIESKQLLVFNYVKISEKISLISDEIISKFQTENKNIDIDAKMDTCFGIALYSLQMTSSAIIFHKTTAEGRLMIRVLTELYIVISYLIHKDDKELWKKYRSYGNGQSKLSFLKLSEIQLAELPAYLSIDDMETLSNEDMWQEFESINIGNWSGSDLRKMSEEAGIKNIYDKYYSWPSGYVHGNWGAIRDTVFEQCYNPLHRLHRIPCRPRQNMLDLTEDAVHLCNMILDVFGKAFPGLKQRITKYDTK